ncbi:antihemorrhagic factor cHLP-B-like [Cyprinodon tularosa]|uniref:antihemorrhagic factor cHLP-B-like n=1 Tax=Cyprinodon tularosa TaxID=77115 RepID=UPI0018E234F3|nr:antihemorrhagic factor cHLP-B-like [Cyprinodon tularosa]
MHLLSITVALGLLGGILAQVNVLRPACDSPEAEEAAIVAQDYLNAHHTHGYKYALNRIEEIKIYHVPEGDNTYVLEVELLETDCHVLDPTPVANCTVRPKHLTAIEGDCDVVLKKVGSALTVTAFKCKTEESREDVCVGCSTLLPLNHTQGLEFVKASLNKLNNVTQNLTYTLLDVGRMSTQVVSGGQRYISEFVVIEASCVNDTCVPLNDTMAARGICTSEGMDDPSVNCKMFSTLMPLVDANSTAMPVLPPHVHVHSDRNSHKHGFGHHKLTAHHNPHMSGYLSAESAESAEVVPVAPAINVSTDGLSSPSPASDDSSSDASSSSAEVPIAVVKREAPASIVGDAPAAQNVPVAPVQLCPGRIRFF